MILFKYQWYRGRVKLAFILISWALFFALGMSIPKLATAWYFTWIMISFFPLISMVAYYDGDPFSTQFLLLPISRRDYVSGRNNFHLVVVLGLMVLSALWSLVFKQTNVPFPPLLATAFLIFGVQLLYFPVTLKFGKDSFLALCFLMWPFFLRILGPALTKFKTYIGFGITFDEPFYTYFLLLITILSLILSRLLSQKIVEGEDF